jgi:hypothetical protein
MIEVFFVETADFVSLEDVDKFLERIGVKRQDFLVVDFLKFVSNENQIDLSSIENKIILDEKGRLVSFEASVDYLLAEGGAELRKEQEDHEGGKILFVLGNKCSSEEDLSFVNQVWKKYENEAGKHKVDDRAIERDLADEDQGDTHCTEREVPEGRVSFRAEGT